MTLISPQKHENKTLLLDEKDFVLTATENQQLKQVFKVKEGTSEENSSRAFKAFLKQRM